MTVKSKIMFLLSSIFPIIFKITWKNVCDSMLSKYNLASIKKGTTATKNAKEL